MAKFAQQKSEMMIELHLLLFTSEYPPGQKCFPTNRDFRSGRVIRLLAIQGQFTSTFSPVARQLLVFRTYDIYGKFFLDSNSAL